MAGLYFQIGADFNRLRQLKKEIDDLRLKLQGMDKSVDKKGFEALEKQLQRTTSEYNKLGSQISKYVSEQNAANKVTNQSADGLSKLIKTGAAIGGISFGVEKFRELGMEIIRVHGQMQQLDIAFTTMLKSADKADKLMSGLRAFATETPFGLMDSASGAKQLLAYGSTAENVVNELRMLGNVASGVSQPLGDLVYLYGTLRSQGRAYAMDIRQFAGRGIPIYAELAKVMKINVDQVNDFVSAGKVGFPEVEKAFKNMTSDGGMFEGLMEKQTGSVLGQIEKLKDNTQFMLDSIGKGSEGVIYKSIDGLSTLVENYESVAEILLSLIATYGLYRTALITTAAIRPVQMAQTYEAQAVALTKLLNGEQAYRISQMGLVQGSAEHVAAIKAEIAARADNLQFKLAEEQINLQTLRTKTAEAEQAWMTAKAKTEAGRQELASAISTATAEAEASLQKKMALESEKQSRAALRLVKLQDQKDAAIEQAKALQEKGASDIKVAAKQREIATIQAKIVAAREEEIQHGRNVIAARAELKAGIQNVTNKQIQTLSNKVNTLSEQENAAATAHSGYIKQMVGSKILIKKLATDAETASTTANTAVTTANTVATNVLTAAKAKLISVAKNLWAVLAPNPWLLAAAAVVALGYGIYKLATHMTDAEKATERLNETTKEYESSVESERVKLDILFGRLKSAKEGTDKYKDAKQGILDMADKYHLSIGKDIDLIKEETKYRNILNAAIIETAKARAIETGTQKATEVYTQKWGDNISQIREQFLKRFGESQGELLLDSLKESLSSGTEITKEVQDAIGKFTETVYMHGGQGKFETNQVQILVNEISRSKTILDKEVKDLEGVYGKLQKTVDGKETPTPKAIQDQIFSATKSVQDLKNELKDLQNGIIPDASKKDAGFDFAKTIEEKTKELKEAEDKVSYLLYGKSSSSFDKETKAGESASEKAHKQAQEIADQNEKIKQLVDKQALERKRQDKDLENQATQARINSMQSGAEKQRAQRDYDNKMEIQAIERQKEDSIRAYIQAERELFDQREELELKKNPKYTKKTFDPTSIKVDTTLFDSIVGDVSDSQLKKGFDEIDKAWNDYFLQFGNYQEKRKAIIDKYDKEIAEATTGGEKAILEKQRQNQLDELDNSVKNSTTLMGQLFADASKKSVNEIQAIIDKAELLMNYLEAVKDENGNALINGRTVSKQDILGLGISENTIKNLELSTQEVESLRNAISKLKDELGSKSPFKLFETQIGDAIDKIKLGGKKNITQGITEISSAIDQFSPDVKEFGDSLGTLFGDDKMGDNIGLVIDGIGGVGQAASGVAKIISGDVVGGIMDAVNGAAKAVNAFGTLFGPNGTAEYEGIKSQLEAINKIYESIIANSKEDIVFGGGFASINAASTALDNYTKKVENLKKIAQVSGGAGAAWNSHSAGWHTNKNVGTGNFLEMGKIIDKSVTSISDLYNLTGDELYLIQSQMPEAWGLIDERIRENLQSIIDCKDEAKQLKDALNEALTGVSQDAFYNDFINNLSDMSMSWEDMCDDFEDSLRKSIIAGLVADQYRDRINALYQSWSDAAKSDGRITEDEAKRLREEYQNIVKDMAKDRGDLANSFGWDNTSGSSQSSTRGGYETITQDQAGSIDGRLTGIHETEIQNGITLKSIEASAAKIALWNQPISEKFNIDGLITPLNSISQSALRVEQMIEENRNIAIQTYYIVRDIKGDTSYLPEINEGIKSIRKNTDAFNKK